MNGTFSKWGLVIVFITYAMTLVVFLLLPEEIPVHFSGSSTSWADKWSLLGIAALFAIPTVSAVMCGFMDFLIPVIRSVAKDTNQAVPKYMDLIVPLMAISLLILQISIIGLIMANI
jgi:Protein of unknown function (DUF1648).